MYREKMNLSKRCRLLVLSGFTLLLYGTALLQGKKEREVASVSSEYILKKPNLISFTNEVYEKSYYNSNNKLCLSLVYRYPLIANAGNENLIEINKQIEKQKNEWITSQQDLIEDAKQQDLICNTNGNEVNYGVTYNEDDILSILFEGYLYAGGAHGMPYRMPQTFRVSTGKPMSLSEVTGLTEDQVQTKVNEKFRILYEQNPGVFWNNARELVEKLSYKEYSYYVENNGVHVYFDPYFVAPFAAGFIDIIL